MDSIDKNDIENTERREVMAALLKYSAVVGGASTVILSASDAVAKSAASGSGNVKKKCNNGHGNGDDCVPGKSWKNQAENKGADPIYNPNPDGTHNAPGNSGKNGKKGS